MLQRKVSCEKCGWMVVPGWPHECLEFHEWSGTLSSGVTCVKCGAGPFFLARELEANEYCIKFKEDT